MATDLDRELDKLLVGTNDLRRRTGQAFYHFYRTLVFWADKGLSFHETTKVWMGAGAAIFRLTASSLETLGDPQPDAPLRGFCAGLLERLAEDVVRGDHTRISHVRWLESRFPELTQMMRREAGSEPIYDAELARTLAETFVIAAGGTVQEMAGTLNRAAAVIREGVDG